VTVLVKWARIKETGALGQVRLLLLKHAINASLDSHCTFTMLCSVFINATIITTCKIVWDHVWYVKPKFLCFKKKKIAYHWGRFFRVKLWACKDFSSFFFYIFLQHCQVMSSLIQCDIWHSWAYKLTFCIMTNTYRYNPRRKVQEAMTIR